MTVLRSRQFLSEEGHPVSVSLDYPGRPFHTDCGSAGEVVYVYAPFADEHLGNEVWGVYRVDWLENPDYETGYYAEQDADGSLKLDNFHRDREVLLSSETVAAICAFAHAGGTALSEGRGRLAGLAA